MTTTPALRPRRLTGASSSRRAASPPARSRSAAARSRQTPKPGGVFISAQNNEATGLDPQLVPAFSRSRRSPLMYNQLVRFDADMTPVPELAESWEASKDGLDVDVQAPPGREVPRWPGDDVGRRQVHLRPPVREVAAASRTSSRSTRSSRRASTPSSSSPRSRSPGCSPRSAASGASSSARRASRSTATSTRPRSAPGPSCWSTGRSSSRWC